MARADRTGAGHGRNANIETLHGLEHAHILERARKLYADGKYADAATLAHKVLRRDAQSAAAMHLIGRIALETGANEIALGMLARALARMPRSAGILMDYAQAMGAEGRHAEAITAWRKAIALRPENADAHCGLGDALLDQDKRAEALACYRKALAVDPGHRLAAHMVAGLTGEPADAGYVTTLFDTYAGDFDRHLTGRLGYRVPALMAEAVARHAPDPVPLALDIGCGTGLMAEALGARIEAMDGIDLSPKMIAAARAKGIYRNLVAGDAVAVMAENPDFAGSYGLVAAGDVFVYLGDLGPVFAAARRALLPGGLFVFTVEHVQEGDAVLRSSGRTAHGPAYIERLAAENGFVIIEAEPVELRKERDRPIAGRLNVLRAAPAESTEPGN